MMYDAYRDEIYLSQREEDEMERALRQDEDAIDAGCDGLDETCAEGNHRLIKDGRCVWCQVEVEA